MRGLDLGRRGEEGAERLLDALDLGDGFMVCLVWSSHREARDELRRRLTEAAPRLEQWRPGDGLLERCERSAASLEPDGPRPVIWLEERPFAEEPWRVALDHLNFNRETFMRRAPWLWVIAGPDELVPLFRAQAPDLLSGVSVNVHLDQPPKPLPPQTRVRWLHLSDFHFKGDERWDRRATLRALLEHAEELKKEDLAPDFVLITGDVAFSGQRLEYQQAERFFSELAKVLELDPLDRFFLVPGNHDVDRKKIGPFDDAIVGSLDSQEKIGSALSNAPTLKLLGRRLEEFYAFTERFLGLARGWREERPWRVDVRELGGLRIAFVQLNSAWTSGSLGEKHLLVGYAQLREALEDASDAFLRLVLVHHPIADLLDVDRERLETLLTAPGGAHLLLRGHLHRQRTQAIRTPDGTVVELAAGAAYVSGEYPKTHLLTELDLSGPSALVRYYRYSPEGRGFWAPDTLTYENAKDGTWRFDLPAELRLGEAEPVAVPVSTPLSEARHATLTARYRSTAAAVHGSVRFVGFADSRPRVNVQVPELFVPLELARQDVKDDADDKIWPTSRLLSWLLARASGGKKKGDGVHRAVVLGDPGSGKTTLCKFATAVLGGIEVEGIDVDEAVLPLLVPFRDYVRSCRQEGDHDLLTFLKGQAAGQLQLTLPDDFLERALEDGRAVLLLDGLDEVGSADERETMRDRVRAFCLNYPRVAALVTSRVAGYDEAPLPKDVFRHFALQSFDDDGLRQFVHNWYAVQEAEDPLARDRGIADLLAAMASSPQIAELAKNPMLATLIALVHRFEAHLPGERAKLYELCVKTMLETWPAARRRRFVEIDEGLQRAYLEALAYRMQIAREHDSREVVIERDGLITALTEIIEERTGTKAPETKRRLVERWVDFLAAGTGLLVEQRRSVFAFFHLSLMEYLAACGAEQEVEPVEMVVERYGDARWREVCLLAVGKRATDKAFLDELYESLSEKAGAWLFLLRAMRDEAAFTDGQRDAILRGAGRYILGKQPYEWQAEQRVVDDLLRFSLRHAEWVRDWLQDQLDHAEGEDLRGLVALRFQHENDMLEALKERGDAVERAADLLDFGVETEIGAWALVTARPEALECWAREVPSEFLLLRVVDSRHATTSLTRGFLLNRIEWMGRIAAMAQHYLDTFSEHGQLHKQGLPTVLQVAPGSFELAITMTWPGEILYREFFLESHPILGLTRGELRTSTTDLGRYFSRSFHTDLSKYLARYFTHDFVVYFIEDIVWDFIEDPPSVAQTIVDSIQWSLAVYSDTDLTRFFDEPFGIDINKNFVVDFAKKFFRGFQEEFSIRPKSDPPKRTPTPVSSQWSSDLVAWQQLKRCKTEGDLLSLFMPIIARFTAEILIGYITASSFKPSNTNTFNGEEVAYFRERLQNAWLLQVWPGVDAYWDDRPEPNNPENLALYLTLGWTQATTTHQWPATERWIALLSGDPPEHWLPRSQWHVCWLLADRDDAEHRRAYLDAIAEGRQDAERPGMAEELAELLGI